MPKIQESWSKNSSLGGPFADRQKGMARSPSYSVCLYVNIFEIADDSLKVKVQFDKSELNDTYASKYFPLDITMSDFLKNYGSIPSFKERLKNNPIRGKLIFNFPNTHLGKIIITDSSLEFDNNDKLDNFSIGNLVHGLDSGNKKMYIALKSDNTKNNNTGIFIADNNLHLAATPDKFIEINDKGISLSGPINFQVNPSQITFGGIMTLPGFYRGLIPSTVATPNPIYLPNIPIETIKLMKDLAMLTTSMAI